MLHDVHRDKETTFHLMKIRSATSNLRFTLPLHELLGAQWNIVVGTGFPRHPSPRP